MSLNPSRLLLFSQLESRLISPKRGLTMRRLFLVLCLSSAFALAILCVSTSAQPASIGVQQPSAKAPDEAVVQRQSVTAYTLSPEKYEKAIAYSRATYRLHFLGAAYSLILLLIIISLRIAPAFRDRAERVSRRRFDLLKSPLDAYRHHLDVKYGLSIQGWGSWAWDWSKGEILKVILASVLAYILYGVVRPGPPGGWKGGGAGEGG